MTELSIHRVSKVSTELVDLDGVFALRLRVTKEKFEEDTVVLFSKDKNVFEGLLK